MNSTTTKPWEHCLRENGPRKKPRTGLSNDSVSELNVLGITYMLSGCEEDAERCFSQALNQINKNTLSQLYSIDSSISNNLEVLPSSSTDQVDVLPPSPPTGSEDMTVQANCSVTHLCIYQLPEYDEGMYYYREPLPLEDYFSCESARFATLLYNMAQTHVRRGKYFEAKKWFQLALMRQKMADAAPISLVRIFHNLGHCFYRLRKNEDALRCYKKARTISEESKLGSCYKASANVAIAVLFFHSNHDLDDCLKLSASSLSVYQSKHGESSKEVAAILNNMGRVHYLRENYDDALRFYKQALDIRRKCLEENSIDIAATVCNIGQTYHYLGHLDKAMEYYIEFLEKAEQYRPVAFQGDVTIICKCVAGIHRDRGQMEQAKEMYEKALAIGRAALGPRHPDLISILHKLGSLHYEMSNLDTALQYYNEAHGIERSIYEPCHPNLLVTLMNLAQIYRLQSNFSAALFKYVAVHSIQIKLFGPNSLQVAETLLKMGLMEYHLKAYSAALETYQAALCIQRDHYNSSNSSSSSSYPPQDNLEIASTLNSIGLTLFSLAKHSLAQRFFHESLRIRLNLLGPNHRHVSILWYNLATTYLEMGDGDLAIRLYKEAVRVERLLVSLSRMGNDDDYVDDYVDDDVEDDQNDKRRLEKNFILTLQHVGLVHQVRGELDEALDYFYEACDILRTMIPRRRQKQKPAKGTHDEDDDDEEEERSNSSATKSNGNSNNDDNNNKKNDGNNNNKTITGTLIALGKLLNLIGNIHLCKGDVGEMMRCYTEVLRIYTEADVRGSTSSEPLIIGGYTFYGHSKLHPPSAAMA